MRAGPISGFEISDTFSNFESGPSTLSRGMPRRDLDRDIKRLVTQLIDRGYESDLLDRLRPHFSVEESHAVVENEIRQEIAVALGRSGMKVDVMLLQLELVERELDALDARTPDAATHGRALEEKHDALRQVAEQRRWELKIHREAVGLRDHRQLREQWPIPGPRRRWRDG